MSVKDLKNNKFFKKNRILNNVPRSSFKESFKEKGAFKKLVNRKGSSLILAIVAIALISILSTLVLSVSLNAYKASVQNKWADEDFFYCEEYLEDTRGAAVRLTNDIFLSNYKNVLDILANSTPDEINLAFREGILLDLESSDELKGLFNKTVDVFNDKNEKVGQLNVSYNSVEKGSNMFAYKGVKVELIDGKRDNNTNFYASITTDIIIEIPVLIPALEEDHKGALDYIFVSGNNISFNGSDVVNSVGNIYGTNLSVSNTADVKLLSDYVTLHNQINNSKNLSISGYSTTANIWCKDIIINGSKSSTSIFGNAFVNDDLEINGTGCSVQLAGKYYGYGEGTTSSSLNSAIIVNGSGTLLDMTGINQLAIKGNSYLSIQQGSSNGEYEGSEALATMVSQSLYMVNSKYIDFTNKVIKIGEKSISFASIGIESLLSSHTIVTGGVDVVDIDLSEAVFASDYLTSVGNMVTYDTYTVEGKNYLCLYWNFAENQGEKFISKCISNGLVDGFLDKFMNGGYIKLNPNVSVSTTADLYEYVIGENGYTANKLDKGNSEMSFISNFSNAYKWFSSTLTPEKYDPFGEISSFTGGVATIFREGYFDFRVISNTLGNNTGRYELIQGNNNNHLILSGDLRITESGWTVAGVEIPSNHRTLKGVIFVNGSVEIDADIDFRGMIVANGDITVKKGTYNSDEDVVKDCIKAIKSNLYSIWNDLVSDEFYTVKEVEQSGSNSLNADEHIKYENWTRNKD